MFDLTQEAFIFVGLILAAAGVVGLCIVGAATIIAQAIRISVLLCVLCGAFAGGGDAAAHEPFTAEGITVKDGDTLHVRVLHLGWGVSLTDQTIRCADYDAWEASRMRQSVDVTDAEIVKGKKATLVLAEVARTKRLRIEPNIGKGRDVYGRLLAIVRIVDGEKPLQPLAEFMQRGGHCRGE